MWTVGRKCTAAFSKLYIADTEMEIFKCLTIIKRRKRLEEKHVSSSSIQPAANDALSNIDAEMVRVPPEFINVVVTAFRWHYILLQFFQFLSEFHEIADSVAFRKRLKTHFLT